MNERDRILSLIEREFDLELLLKYRELEELESEVERGGELRNLIEKLILNEYVYANGNDGRLSAPPAVDESKRITRHSSPYSSSATAPSSSAQTFQYDLLPDGTVVRMLCPVCGASKFRSMLGFLNHCRINCKLSFASHEERLERCGVAVPESEVPEEWKWTTGKGKGGRMAGELELVQLRAEVQPTKIVKDSVPMIEEVTDEVLDLESFGCDSSIAKEIASTDATHTASTDATHTASTDTAPHPSTTSRSLPANVSRYYLKRKLIVGNAAKCILKNASTLPKESIMVGGAEGRPGTHLFKLYLKDYGDPVLPFIRFIRVFLHPAYRPEEVVDLHEQPFVLERPAWGEFPIRLQLHFKDPVRNKPIDLYHQLSIFAAVEGKYLECGQTLHEIDLDKRTASSAQGEAAPNEEEEEDVVYVSESEESSGDEMNSGAASPLALLQHQQQQEAINPHYLKYCKYCGLPHHPQTSFGILQKNCAMKPRKIRVSSRSVPWGLFSVEGKTMILPNNNSSLSPGDLSPIAEDASDEEKLIAAVASQLDLPCFQIPSAGTTAFMLAATRVFLRKLIGNACRNVPSHAQRAILDQNLPVVLTPVHLYNAVVGAGTGAVEQFDFLSNAYFSASTSGNNVNLSSSASAASSNVK